MPIEKNWIQVRTDVVNQYANRVLAALEGCGLVEAEMALLAAYVQVAPGVQQFPLAGRSARASLVVQRGAEALVDAIRQVGALSEAAVAAEKAAMTAGPAGTRLSTH